LADPVCLLPVPGFGLLALTPDELRTALSRGRELARGTDIAAPGPEGDGGSAVRSEGHSEPLLTADELGKATGTAPSWWESASSRNQVPHHKIGRFTRFSLREVLESGALQGNRRVIGEAQHTKVETLPLARRLRANK
jgi:hypothetical protein